MFQIQYDLEPLLNYSRKHEAVSSSWTSVGTIFEYYTQSCSEWEVGEEVIFPGGPDLTFKKGPGSQGCSQGADQNSLYILETP